MNQELQPSPEQKLREWAATEGARAEIAAAIGGLMDAAQFTAHMLVAFQPADIRACSTQSKYRALMECAALGLLPTLGQVVLIPYKDTLKAMPQWQGYKAVMERHATVLEVSGTLVHKSDSLRFKNGKIKHEFDPLDESREFNGPDDLRGGYLKIIYRDGRPPRYHFVTRAKIVKAQACAQTQSIWKKWYTEMSLKTLYRDGYARRVVPVDPLTNRQLEEITRVDDANLGNDPLLIDAPSTPEKPTVDDLLNQRDIPTEAEREAAEPSRGDIFLAGAPRKYGKSKTFSAEPEPEAPLYDVQAVDASAEEYCQAFEGCRDLEAVENMFARMMDDDFIQQSPAAAARCYKAAMDARGRIDDGK